MSADTTATSRWRDADGRLRAWLRILLVAVAVMVVAGLAQIPHAWLAHTPAEALTAVLMAASTLLVFTWLSRRLDRRGLRSYGLRLDVRWWTDLAVGLGLGLVIGMVALAVLLTGGWADITQVWSPGAGQRAVGWAIAAGVAVHAAVATWEELVFRGHLMSNAAESLARTRPPRRAVVAAGLISTVVFAAIHGYQFLHPEIPATVVLLWLAMGALFALAYATTGQLALPIGIHLAGNLSFGPLYRTSGDLDAPLAALVRLESTGPAWVVGAGGVVQLAGVAAATAGLLLWLRLRHGRVAIDTALTEPSRSTHEHAT